MEATLEHLQSGDELVVANLAALADDIVALGGIARSLRALGVKLVCLDDRGKQKACAEGEGLGLLDAVAEMEECARERRAAGRIREAKDAGIKFGVKTRLDPALVGALRTEFASARMNRQELVHHYGISKTTLYRLCKGLRSGRRLTPEKIERLKRDIVERSITREEIAARYGISRVTVFRLARQERRRVDDPICKKPKKQ